MNRIFPILIAYLFLMSLSSCGRPATDIYPTPSPSPTDTASPIPIQPHVPESSTPPLSSEKLEFSLMVNNQLLSLGKQSGPFPWGTNLEYGSKDFWSTDGFNCFEFTCGEDLILGGLCLEYEVSENNGTLNRIESRNPDYKTYRGAYIGMPLQDFLCLYPESKMFLHSKYVAYEYTDEYHCGFDQILFVFEDNYLLEIDLGNGIDGWLYGWPTSFFCE